MSGDLSIGEAVKLRRRSSTANSILVKEIAAADEKVLRLRRKLENKRKKKARRVQTLTYRDSEDPEKISIEEVSLTSSAITTFQSEQILHREFSLPPSFTALKPRNKEQREASLLGPSQILDLINQDDSPVKKEESHLLYCQNKSSGETVLAKTRNTQLSLWTKSGGENFEKIFETKLDRILVKPILDCTGDTFTVREFFVEGDQVKLFRFSVLRGLGVKSAIRWSKTSVLIRETADIQDLHCLNVGEQRTVIAYNMTGTGRSRVHIFTTLENRTEVKFLGNVEAEVRNLCLLHGSDQMFIYFCDSQLIIWSFSDGKCLSKPVFFLPTPTRMLGALVIKTQLCFVVRDSAMVKLSIIENQHLKDLKFYQAGGDSKLENLSLLSVKQDFLTLLAGTRVFRLNLKTSEIFCETLF